MHELGVAWRIASVGTSVERIGAVRAAASPDVLATLAPLAQDLDAPGELVVAVLTSSACTVGLAARYATHRDALVRKRVAAWPGMIPVVLKLLALDEDPCVRVAAIDAIAAMGVTAP